MEEGSSIKGVGEGWLSERNRLRAGVMAQYDETKVEPAEVTQAAMDASLPRTEKNSRPWEVDALDYFKGRMDYNSMMVQGLTQRVKELTKITNDMYDALQQIQELIGELFSDEEDDETSRSEVRVAPEMKGYAPLVEWTDETTILNTDG